MGVDVIQRAVFGQEAFGGLLADARHAGDVVGFIAHNGLVIHHLLGADVQFGDDVFGGDVVAVIPGQVDDDARAHQLEQVPVAGDDLDAESLPGGPVSHRAEHIVGFVAFHFEAGDVEGIHQVADPVDLRGQVLRHFGAGALVGRENFIAKSLAGVEGDGKVIGFFHLEYADQLTGEAVCSGGGFAGGSVPALAGSARRESKIYAIGQCMAINEIKSRGHGRNL